MDGGPRRGSPASDEAPATEAFCDLERWFSEAGAGELGLGEIERESERRGRELLRLMLQAHLDARGDGDVGRALLIDGPEGPRTLRRGRAHARRLSTLFGEVSVSRAAYRAPGRPSIHPLDRELRLPARSYSYEVCRRLVRACVLGPFDEAIALLAEMNGVRVPKRSAEQIVREAAADFEAFYAQRAGEASRLAEGEILVGAIDGKGIPMVKPQGAERVVRRGKGKKANKKKMATVAAVYGQPPAVRTPEAVVKSLFRAPGKPPADRDPRPRPTDKRVWASLLQDKDTFIADVKAEMARRDPERERSWAIVTDGERAIQRRVGRIFEGVTLVLDLLHVLEKLWKAAYVLHPEGSPEAEAFVRRRALRILSGQASQVVKGLRQITTKRRLRGAKRKTLLDVAGYYYRNRERMRYDQYLRKGWPIASGSVEGACKNLIKDRMERSGMRWTPAMAEAMLRMRATHLSGDFDAYWDFHVEQDQGRLYPEWTVVEK